MHDSNTIDYWAAAIVIAAYAIWFLFETSKKRH